MSRLLRPARQLRRISTVQQCPQPTCTCATTPPGLDIDRNSSLANTRPFYDRHIIVSTRTADWPSRIENSGDTFVQAVKDRFSAKGKARAPDLVKSRACDFLSNRANYEVRVIKRFSSQLQQTTPRSTMTPKKETANSPYTPTLWNTKWSGATDCPRPCSTLDWSAYPSCSNKDSLTKFTRRPDSC